MRRHVNACVNSSTEFEHDDTLVELGGLISSLLTLLSAQVGLGTGRAIVGALVQMPLLLGVFGALRSGAAHGRFLWMSDLAKPDLALAIVAGVNRGPTPPSASAVAIARLTRATGALAN
jgi:hypothetical protein